MQLCDKGIEIIQYLIKLVSWFMAHKQYCAKCEGFELIIEVRRKRNDETQDLARAIPDVLVPLPELSLVPDKPMDLEASGRSDEGLP